MAPRHNKDSSDRRIRSFVRRTGRVTPGQLRALTELWPLFGLEYSDKLLNPLDAFGRAAPLVVEIGFGNGDLLAEMAQDNPDVNFIGIEVHEPGVGHCLLQIQRRAVTNVRVMRHDAVDILENQIEDGSLQGINLFFPDPWPKKRHHKRRLVQTDFVALAGRKIAPGGYFHAATDWTPYAEHVEETFASDKRFRSTESDGRHRPITKFEQRGKKLGHTIYDLIFDRV